MEKKGPATLIWSELHNGYMWREQNSQELLVQTEEQEWWLVRLAAYASFAFQGQRGHLNLLKERRPRGEEGYWYAYRRQGRQVAKKYVGRTMDLSIARLEELACSLAMHNGETPPPEPAQTHLSHASQGSLHASQHQMPLLLPKLRPPHLRGSLVARERLWTLLDAGLEHKITLLSAPAGFGKTTLVSGWIAARKTGIPPAVPPLGVAWVALDEGDNDPVRFWHYFIAACQTLRPDPGNAALALLRAGQQPPFTPHAQEAMLTALLNDMMQWSGRGLLVLEDYHVITAPEIHQAMSYLIEHLPASLHLILITRSDPLLPLARLRAHGDLLEVGASHLRFTFDETQAFLQQMLPVPLGETTLASLQERTEGWAAGLRLVLLALQGQNGFAAQDVEKRLLTISGSQRHLLDYLITDVLSAQPEPLQTFLLQTSGLNRLTGSLCDAITDRTDGAIMLEQIERANLFLTPLDESGEWYRYHALFAEAMQHEARRRLGEEALCSLASKASRWYELHALLADAIEAALVAGEFERAATLMSGIIESRNFHEFHEFHIQLRWLSRLPEELLYRFPILCKTYALLLLFSKNLSVPASRVQLEGYLRIAEDGFRAAGDMVRVGEVLSLRALIAGHFNDVATSFHAAHQALALLPANDIYWRNIGLMCVSMEHFFHGRLKEAHQFVQEARVISEEVENGFASRPAFLLLGNIYVEQGKLHRAAEVYQRVFERAGDDDFDRSLALAGFATLFYEWNKLDVAEQEAQKAYALGKEVGNDLLLYPPVLVLARIWHKRGQTVQVDELLQNLIVRLAQQRWLPEIMIWQARFALSCGDLDTVQHLLSSRQTILSESGECSERQQEQEALLTARLLIAQGNAQEALPLLLQWRRRAQERSSVQSEIEILALTARAYFIEKCVQEAEQALKEALVLARPSGYQRLFLDEGKDLVPILRATLPIVREQALAAYIRELLRAFALEHDDVDPAATDMLEPLSPQERRVLRLLVAGRSNPEIARELVVSVNTIKAQVKSIYRKLAVSNRIEASEAARRLNY